MASIAEDTPTNPKIEKAKKKLIKQQKHELRMLEQKKQKEAKKIPKDQKPKRMEVYKEYDAKIAQRQDEQILELEALVKEMSMADGDNNNPTVTNFTAVSTVGGTTLQFKKMSSSLHIF